MVCRPHDARADEQRAVCRLDCRMMHGMTNAAVCCVGSLLSCDNHHRVLWLLIDQPPVLYIEVVGMSADLRHST